MLFAKLEALDEHEEPDFGVADHLLLWAWRRIAFGQEDCPLLAREFIEVCGEDGPEVLATARVFLKAIGVGARFRLMLGMPGGFALTRDERDVLLFLAAAQDGPVDRFEDSLANLARREWMHVVAIAAHALANAFAINGLRLSGSMPDMICRQQALAS